MPNIYLLLGSNLDDRLDNISQARHLIYQRIGAQVKESNIYETAPWGILEQAPFLNQALQINSDLKPEPLLKELKKIEALIGRTKTVAWGPRIIDIDILFYDDLIYESSTLNIPHKEIENRRFTLIPLIDIASDLVHPQKNLSIKSLLSRCEDNLQVTNFTATSSSGQTIHENIPTTLHT